MYNALAYDDDSEDDSDTSLEKTFRAEIPSFEDLSSIRMDEVQVLEAVYGDDFWKRSMKGSPIICIRVRLVT